MARKRFKTLQAVEILNYLTTHPESSSCNLDWKVFDTTWKPSLLFEVAEEAYQTAVELYQSVLFEEEEKTLFTDFDNFFLHFFHIKSTNQPTKSIQRRLLMAVKVLVEGSYVGDARNIADGNTVAHQIAFKMGLSGSVHVKYIDEHGNTVGGGTIYV